MPEQTINNNNHQTTALLDPNGLYAEMADTQRIATEENYAPSAMPQTSVKTLGPIIPGAGVYEDAPLPNYEQRIKNVERFSTEMPKQIKDEILRYEPSWSRDKSLNAYANTLKRPGRFNTYAGEVPLSETHQMLSSGEYKSKFDYYLPGINNEDYHARRQSGMDKFLNGMGKLGIKTGIYALQGTIGFADSLINMARERRWSAFLDTDMQHMFEDLATSTDLLLPHYYREETNNYNLGQRIWNDFGNFLWNDVIGTGLAFTTGALATGIITGGMGFGSLSTLGARAGLRWGVGKAAKAAAKAAAVNSKSATAKQIINGYIRKGVQRGRFAGGAVKTFFTLATTSSFEAAIEANSFMKEAEQDFRDYFKETMGRNPTIEELTEFRHNNQAAANMVFAGNMAVLSISNMLMFGRYMGLNSGLISKAERSINKRLFGIGSEVRKPGEMAIKVISPSKVQKASAVAFNVAKRPFSEGVFEEGLQGVAQNAAKDYVDSRYNRDAAKKSMDFWDSVKSGFEEQYTSKEGWTEVGIGAIIGSLFGITNGGGALEASRDRKAVKQDVEAYNANMSNMNTAAKNLMRQAMGMSPQLLNSSEAITSREMDDAMYAKMSMEDKMDMLDDSVDSFETMLKSIDAKEFADITGVSQDKADSIKAQMLDNYRRRLEDYRTSRNVAEELVGDGNKEAFTDMVSRSIFLGISAQERMQDIANVIGEVARDPNLGRSINLYGDLSARERELVKQAKAIQDNVNQIQKKLDEYASRPRVTSSNTGEGGSVSTDPLELEIRRLSGEQSKLLDELNSVQERISGLRGAQFSLSDLTGRTDEMTSNGINPVSVDELTAAYNTLEAFDDYFSDRSRRRAKGESFSGEEIPAGELSDAQETVLKNLVDEYRENLVNYRNMNNFIAKMLDPSFREQEYRGFVRLLANLANTGIESTASSLNETPDFISAGSLKGYASEADIDKAFEEGKITEDESFTLKAFLHTLDSARREVEVLDEAMPDAVYESMLQDVDSNPEIRDRIATKLWNTAEGAADALTSRERAIYNANKDRFDSEVESMGEKPSAVLDRLNRQINSVTNRSNILGQNNEIIKYAKERMPSDDARSQFDTLATDYIDVLKRVDKGENVPREEIDRIELELDTLGEMGGVTLIHNFIRQNYMMMRKSTPTIGIKTDYGNSSSETDALVSREAETKASKKGKSYEKAQNPNILLCKTHTNSDGSILYEVSGLRFDRMAGFTGESPRITARNGAGISFEQVDGDADSYIIHLTTPDGNTHRIIVNNTGKHARWFIGKEDAALLSENTNLLIRDVDGKFAFVYDVSPNGEAMPFRTGIGYGENETEKINQDRLSNISEGEKVSLVISANDSYNRDLLREYENAETEEQKAAAKENLANNMIIRVMSGNELVSVMKANFGDISEALTEIRNEAADTLIEQGSENMKDVVLRKSVNVSNTYPGKPNLYIEAYGSVRMHDITQKGSNRIVGIGYTENGEFVTKGEVGEYDQSLFMSSITNEKSPLYSQRVPFVIIKANNGLKYAYPVQLRDTINVEDNPHFQLLQRIVSSLPSDQNASWDVDIYRGQVAEINSYLAEIGLPASEYQLSYTSNPRSRLEHIIEGVRQFGSKPNMETWTTDSRSTSEIAMSDISINLNLEEEPFIDPYIQLELTSNNSGKASKKKSDNTNGDTLPFTDGANSVEKGSKVEAKKEINKKCVGATDPNDK